MNNITFKQLRNMTEEQARETLESICWPDGPICPHCESTEAYKLTPKEGSKTRPGLYKCKACRKQFTVTVGTVMERSRIKIADWLMAFYLMCSSKKGISAHQLHRTLGVSYETAWFMAHRIRYAMTQEPLSLMAGTVEADETYIGGKAKNKHASKRGQNDRGRSEKTKTPVFALVNRDGQMMAKKVPTVNSSNLKEIIRSNVSKDATIITDQYSVYNGLENEFPRHATVDHGRGEYVRGNIHTNTVEGWFSILKRDVTGTFHHVSEEHLDRYVDEFVFRYNNRDTTDSERAAKAVKATKGKRLYYKQPN